MNNKTLSVIFIFLLFIKVLSIYSTNFNLFGDEAQYWLWSKDLDFGYFSKPPFLSWFIFIYTSIFGESFFSLKLLPSMVYFLIAFSFYDLSKNIGLNKSNSFSCALVFIFIPAVSFSSFIVSTDLFLILFWVLSLSTLIKIKKNPSLKNFFLLGVLMGLAMLSKYAAIYFILCLIIYFFLDKDFRILIQKNSLGVLICLFCFIAIIFPNIFWNISNGWVTVQHTSDNANFDNIQINFLRGLAFLGIQVLMVGPVLFFTNILNYNKLIFDSNTKLLLIFSIPIFLIVFGEAVIVRANANWAAPALISFYLLLYINTVNLSNIYAKLNILFNFVFCAVFFILIGFTYPAPFFNRIKGLNNYALEVMSSADNLNINNFVISDRLLFSSLSYELRNYKKPLGLNFYMPHKQGEKITNHFKISSPLKKEINKSFVFIGNPYDIDYLDNKFYCYQGGLLVENENHANKMPAFKICKN